MSLNEGKGYDYYTGDWLLPISQDILLKFHNAVVKP